MDGEESGPNKGTGDLSFAERVTRLVMKDRRIVILYMRSSQKGNKVAFMNEEVKKIYRQKKVNINKLGNDKELINSSYKWIAGTSRYNYTYNFEWLGRPIIQFPQDIVAMQEILWEVKPNLVIETGIAHGGSLIFYASILELIGKGEVLGIDIDIREHNRKAIEEHPMFKRIAMIEGSSISEEIADQVRAFAEGKEKVLVCLDSNHTHEHVLKEMELYSPLVTKGSYLVVFDTAIEDMPDELFKDKPWGKGNNPKTAVAEFLKTNDSFAVEKDIDNKLLITVAPGGYLRRVG